jgi:hypothetical protein
MVKTWKVGAIGGAVVIVVVGGAYVVRWIRKVRLPNPLKALNKPINDVLKMVSTTPQKLSTGIMKKAQSLGNVEKIVAFTNPVSLSTNITKDLVKISKASTSRKKRRKKYYKDPFGNKHYYWV